MAGTGGIPRHVRAFVREHLRSITQLDLLLRLHSDPKTALSAEDLSRELRVPERFLTALLLDFAAVGVLSVDEGPVPAWRFDRTSRHAAAIDELARFARQRKRAVHDLILSGLDSDVQVFSDAFKLRRED